VANLFLLLYQKYGNACLGILNGSDAGLEDLNIVGGRKPRQNLLTNFRSTLTPVPTDIFSSSCRRYNAGSDGDI
jgi:hypothetical protein